LTLLLIPKVILIKRKSLWALYVPCVKGVSEKFKRIANRYNIVAIFKYCFRDSFMKTKPERDPQLTAQCVYSIPCEYGRSYAYKTGRPLAVRLLEPMHNLKDGLLETSKLAQHAYEEGHGMELGFWKLKVTAGIESTRNRTIWHV
jgi:hypothetical protein